MVLREIVVVPNTWPSLLATSAAEVRIAEGQLLLEVHKSRWYTEQILKTNSFKKRRTEFSAKADLNEVQSMDVTPPLM
jgi:hypothetical protein